MSVVIVAGIPGAGKSTLLRGLVRREELLKNPTFPVRGVDDRAPFLDAEARRCGYRVEVFSTDHFFETPEGYKFEPARLGEAHGWCLRSYLQHLEHLAAMGRQDPSREVVFPADDHLVVVDNTNTSIPEIAPYAAAALAYGHRLQVVAVLCDPKTAWSRNTHGVPAETVFRMDARLRETLHALPPYWPLKVVYQ